MDVTCVSSLCLRNWCQRWNIQAKNKNVKISQSCNCVSITMFFIFIFFRITTEKQTRKYSSQEKKRKVLSEPSNEREFDFIDLMTLFYFYRTTLELQISRTFLFSKGMDDAIVIAPAKNGRLKLKLWLGLQNLIQSQMPLI